jgi:hypothetical protein
VKIQAIVMAAGVALVPTYAIAAPLQRRVAGMLPPAKINGTVRSMGLMPAGQPVRQGDTYAVLATSRRGKSVPVASLKSLRFCEQQFRNPQLCPQGRANDSAGRLPLDAA